MGKGLQLLLRFSCLGALVACSGMGKVSPSGAHSAGTAGVVMKGDSGTMGSTRGSSGVGTGGIAAGGVGGTSASVGSSGSSGASHGGTGARSASGGGSGSPTGGAGGASSTDAGTASSDGGAADAGSTSGMCGGAACASTRCAAWSCGAAVCCTLQSGVTCVHGSGQCPSSAGDEAVLQCWSGSQTAYGFAKDCASKTDCVVAQHWMGCCNVHAIGLKASEQSRFDSFEASCGGAPPCGCCCDRVTADDGNIAGSGTTPSVDCVAGVCRTMAP